MLSIQTIFSLSLTKYIKELCECTLKLTLQV